MKPKAGLIILRAALAFVVLFATFARGLQEISDPNWFERAALAFQQRSLLTALVAGVALIVLEAIERIAGGFYYRRRTIRACLNRLAEQCSGRPKRNRLTVFKRVSGVRALLHGLWVLKGAWFRPRGRRKLTRLREIQLFESYLIVYVRSSEARNKMSSATFRISDRRQDCEGLAGLTWEEGLLIRENLPKIARAHVDGINDLDALTRRRKNDPLRQYVERTNITSMAMLESIETYGRHFMGEVINKRGSGPWGVLLLDSEEDRCPFPVGDAANPSGGCLRLQFQACAETVGHMVR